MSEPSDSTKFPEPDDDRLWLKGSGAEISVRMTTDKRALDIVEAIRRRYRKRAFGD